MGGGLRSEPCGGPAFDRLLYQKLKGKGFKLDEVIQEQFDKIAGDGGLREAVEKGLLLDLLEFFTTREGTADTHTRREIRDRYPSEHSERPDALLDALLEACKSSYLLADVGVGADGTKAYRLTHDTLAPLLRERFVSRSPWPSVPATCWMGGLRAGKASPPTRCWIAWTWASVEKGLPWMRALEKDEPAVLAASRRAEERRWPRKKSGSVSSARRGNERNRRGSPRKRDQKSSDPDQDRGIPSAGGLADAVRPQQLDLAMLLAVEAAGEDTSKLGGACNALSTRVRKSFASSTSPRALSRAWPSGRRARSPRDMAGGVAVLRRPWRAAPTHAAGGQGGQGQSSVAFGPEGKIAAGYGFDGGGGVVLFDARGERLRPTPLEVKEGHVTSVAFGPEGKIAAGYEGGGGGGVVLFDARGERLRPTPLEVKEGSVTSVAFGPEGKIAAGYERRRRRRRGAFRRRGRAAPTHP